MPTDEQRALWHAIRANPDDDTPRLVYADWLDEHNEPARAEFIRVQCEIERLRPDQRARRKVIPGLEHRAWVLQTANRARWLEPLFRVLVRQGSGVKLETWGVSFERGFAHGVALDIDGVHRLMTAEGELEPVFDARVWQRRAWLNAKKLAAVFAWDGISCAELLAFSGATDNDIGALTTSTAARLSKVWFRACGLSDAAAEFLAAWPCARFVRELNLSGNRIGDRGASALAASPHLSDACQLNVERNPLTAHGRHKLVARFGGNVTLSSLA
jgi:uncharacterized protein (TIGR02996 family)